MSALNNTIASAPKDKKWSEQEICTMLRDAMAVRSLSVNRDKDQLLTELEIVEEALQPIKSEIERCEQLASVTATRYAVSFIGIICM